MLLHSQYWINLNIYCKCGTATNVLTILAEAKKILLFPETRPTLIFWPDTKVFLDCKNKHRTKNTFKLKIVMLQIDYNAAWATF